MNDTQLLISIGGAGCKILSKFDTDLDKLYIDTDPRVVEIYSKNTCKGKGSQMALRIGEKNCGENSASGDVAIGEVSLTESWGKISNYIEKYSKIVIVTSLGGGTSCGATKKLAEFCKLLSNDVVIVSGLPFEFEGQLRNQKALKACNSLSFLCKLCTTKYQENEIPGRKTLQEAFDLEDEKVMQLLESVMKDSSI